MKRNERDEPRCERCGHFNHDNVWCEVDVIVSSGPVFEMCGCKGEANEAAERLRSILNNKGAGPKLLTAALAAEHRDTVERIREAWEAIKHTRVGISLPDHEVLAIVLLRMDAILDEEAAR